MKGDGMHYAAMTKMKHVRRLIYHHADFDFTGWPIVSESDDLEAIKSGIMSIVNEIDEWHLKRWRSGLGYHFLIGNGHGIPDGYPAIGRPMKYQGAHVRGHNHDSVGILIVGDLTKHEPTDRQVATAAQLAANLCFMFGLDPNGEYSRIRFGRRQKGNVISGHHDWSGHRSNDCPGSFAKYLDGIRLEAEGLIFSRMSALPYTP
jgi:N-acetylmuramoyl-L-alanine amidase